jgi:hypothetical protein
MDDDEEERGILRTYATLRLMGENLDPQRVTAQLGITPSQTHRAGERSKFGGVYPTGYWALTSKDALDTEDLEEHIDWLLRQVEPISVQWLEQQAGVRADVFCFVEINSGAGLPFSSTLLGRLAALNLLLDLDIYCT